ncbi:MAG TPA: hypothetical protein VMB51_04295 [Solirubrobacteraceae bacterium]|nr:hypothetical protein [Solirubrobacteraceae bacterium]
MLFDELQRLVLCILLARTCSGLCSLDELAHTVGDRGAVRLAVDGLHAAGLVHRLEGFVFPSGPAVRFYELQLAGAAHLLAGATSPPTMPAWHDEDEPCRSRRAKKRRFFPCGKTVKRRV